MITSKEKAEELVLKYLRIDNNTKEWFNKNMAKQCALICCNEVLGYMGADRGYEFWTNVKQEIEKL
jgi:hypothetical protein